MIDVNELRKGVTFEFDGNLYKVLEYDHHKPGRGKATIRVIPEIQFRMSGLHSEMQNTCSTMGKCIISWM